MKRIFALMTAALMLPTGVLAQDLTGYTDVGTRVCSVAEIQADEGICSQVEMPVPPQDVVVRVYRRPVTTVTELGGLGAGAGAAGAAVVVLVAAALAGGSSNGTNGTN